MINAAMKLPCKGITRMILLNICLLSLMVGVGAFGPKTLKSPMPYGASCSLQYGDVMKSHDWICEESQFQTYPKDLVVNLLQQPEYLTVNDYLKATGDCGIFHDADPVYGKNEYYTYESVCKMVRRPITVLWYKVPDYVVPPELMGLNNGLLPVHVLEGQNLYDVQCFHPWAKGIPAHIPKRMARRLSQIRWDEVKERLCLSGYNYNDNLVCKPTGYIERQVYVYSQHANKIFPVTVPDVPTYCECSYCRCHRKG